MIKIRGHELDIDVYEEISNYEWERGSRKGEEYVCCSPFRDETNPSFSINLDTGLWIDFGSTDDYWKRGNLVKLISFLENVTFEEAEDMLLEAYGIAVDKFEDEELIINIQTKKQPPKTFTKEELKPYLFRNKSYLARRGISEEVMKEFVVGYDKEKEAVAFFWRDWKTGKVVNAKFRSINSKVFYYLKNGQQIRNHLFGLYNVIKGGYKEVYLVESEIDCLYLWTLGLPAIAIGGSNFTEEQKRKLLLSGIETLVLATDRDKVGFTIRKQIIRELGGMLHLKELFIPPYAKDVNDLNKHELLNCVETVEKYKLKIL